MIESTATSTTGSVAASNTASITALLGFRRPEGQNRLALGGLAVFAVLAALSTEDGPVLCPIRRCSGGYCPACGMTRSGGRLLRGDLAGSWQQHPYLLILAPQVVLAAVLFASGVFGRLARPGRMARIALAGNAAVMLAIWVARMSNGSIPIPFFS